MFLSVVSKRGWRVAAASGLVAMAAAAVPITSAVTASAASSSTATITSTGLEQGAIKHVWLIILENKSYDATFTGLNQNTYL